MKKDEKPEYYIKKIIHDGSALIKQITRQDQNIITGIRDMLILTGSYGHIFKRLFSHFFNHPEIIVKGFFDKFLRGIDKTDKRFKNKAWQNKPFNHFKNAYLNLSHSLQNEIDHIPNIDPFTRQQAHFITRVILDFLAPNNFLFFNPDILDITLEQKGLNLLRGFSHFLSDLVIWQGYFNVTRCPYDKFLPGENIAITPGAVVYRNQLFELIAYDSPCGSVSPHPLLIVTSWINKYYILDLQAQNSFIKWLTEQGFQVYTISWQNPDNSFRHLQFEDYVLQGVLSAIDVIYDHHQKSIHAVGYCLGGTLLATAAAYLSQTAPEKIKSLTLLASMINFEKAGEMKKLLGDEQIEVFEKSMKTSGLWDARKMAAAFNLLDSNDFFWPFHIRYYLRGELPVAHEMIYWAQDYTHTPEKLFSFYMRGLYRENQLVNPKFFKINNVNIDFNAIHVPVFCLGLQEDNLSPWPAAFASAQLFSQCEFILGEGTHVSGTIVTPRQSKLGFYTNLEKTNDPDTWLAQAHYQKGSWWTYWLSWLAPLNEVNNKPLPWILSLEKAPGNYVMKSVF